MFGIYGNMMHVYMFVCVHFFLEVAVVKVWNGTLLQQTVDA